jgi:hypothetical protein
MPAVEFIVRGVPVSLSGSSKGRKAWQKAVSDAAAAAWGHYPLDVAPLKAAILYCSDGASDLDVDNIAKPILDALNGLIYEDDRQVRQILIRIWENMAFARMQGPSTILLRALKVIHKYHDFVYVRISDELDLSEMPQ